MKRIRLTLVLLGLGIALPTALILERALASLALENEVRHEAVAERIFDEMERSLSEWLAAEEARPPEEYDAARRIGSEGGVGQGFVLAEGGDESFVVGRFVIAAGGGQPEVLTGFEHAPRVEAALEETWSGLASPRGKVAGQARPSEPSLAAQTPAPGRTRMVGKKRSQDRPEAQAPGPLDEKASAYEVLQSLNRAGQLRSERKAKASSAAGASAPPSERFAKEEAFFDDSELSASAPAVAEAEIAADLGDLGADESFEEDVSDLDRLDAARDLEGRREESRLATEFGRPGVDPLIGRATSEGDLVLARSVWRQQSVERQGLVLDRNALIAWLEQRVLAESGLGDRARLDFGVLREGDASGPGHRYLHRFAEPFDALTARLDLDALPGIGSARPLYALALLLFAVASLGLFAIHRMTAVVIDYAERRANFVAAVSHELKTPLTSIRMYAEMLRDGLVPTREKQDEYHATITDESERLSRLIENVLEFSRLEKGRELRPVVGDLARALREACEKLEDHVEREGFRFRLEVEPDLPTVEFDRDALTQLVFNLVDNALKYASGASEREIVVRLVRSGEGIELCVRDFGPGVPERDLERVFEPFYRVGQEMTRTSAGSGIGLALVKQLAEGMGARARGRNAPGGGFEVSVRFAIS